MRSLAIVLAALALYGTQLTASAEAQKKGCTCRGPDGSDVALGRTICLKTPRGSVLARCETVLNNTSWKFLGTPCPQAEAPGTGGPARRQVG